MRSMTGFGVGEGAVSGGKAVAEIRTVNSRHLEVRVRMPRELGETGLSVEQQVRGRLGRGRCDVAVRLDIGAEATLQLDLGRARAAMAALRRLRDEFAPGGEVPLSLLAAVPDVFAPPEGRGQEDFRQGVQAAVERALDDLEVSRRREGAGLKRDLGERLARLRAQVRQVEERLPRATEAYRGRVEERLRQALAGLDVSVEPRRLEQEIVAFIERSDVAEELTRLRLHLDALDELMAAADPVGRQIDFMLQEVGRELNTLGAKSLDAAVTRAVIEARGELERLREQVQNVE